VSDDHPATEPTCEHRWEDGWASEPTPHVCVRNADHERMHVCECGAVVDP
jgi:hypothetical protein